MILVFGGTSDSIKLMEGLLDLTEDLVLSVATDYGKVYSSAFQSYLIQGRMNLQDMVTFIRENSISLILDASHPFAQILSETAIEAAVITGCDYIRYERPGNPLFEGVHYVTTIEQACQLIGTDKVYLTTGSKSLAQYCQKLSLDQMQIRVLPTAQVLEACENLGFQAQQIDAIKGPFSQELNQALFEKSGAKWMVTKDSGDSGGLSQKVFAAKALGMSLIIIQRPALPYPLKFEDMEALLAWVKNSLEEAYGS